MVRNCCIDTWLLSHTFCRIQTRPTFATCLLALLLHRLSLVSHGGILHHRIFLPAEATSLVSRHVATRVGGNDTVTRACKLLSAISIFLLYPQNAPMSNHNMDAWRYWRSLIALLSFSAFSIYQNFVPSYMC